MVRLFDKDDLNKIVIEIKKLYYNIRTVGYSFQHIKAVTLNTIDNLKVDLDNISYIKDNLHT